MIEISGKRLAGPIIRLHPSDNVVVARVDVGIGTAVPTEGFTSRSQVPAGHKIAARADPQGRADPQVQRGASASRPPTSRRARSCIRTTWSSASSTATTPMRSDYRAGRDAAGSASARASWASCATNGQVAHAQLHRRAVHGELLGDGRAQDRRIVHARAARRLSERRRRRRLRARHRLRHGDDRRADGPAAPHDGRLRAPRQPRRRADRRPGLRAQPDQRPA